VGKILVGTAGWTDPTLLRSGRFYPKSAKTAESRLRHYAACFPLVEVDATYYAPPNPENTRAWAERTPDGFVFDVKAFALLTKHPTKPAVLPRDLRDLLPAETREKSRVYPDDVGEEMVDELWRRFVDALSPLKEANKLGSVLLQFPPWFVAGDENAKYIGACKKKLGDVRASVELRHASWLSDSYRERTLRYLERHELPLVCVDMPQGFDSSLPPLAAVTTKKLALVRFHGRNRETWKAKTKTAAERFKYLYPREELEEWRPKIEEIAERAEEVHVIMNNCFEDYAVRNAHDMMDILHLPEPT
jgi:uncharacterized protein YecE (DUF72 family)